MKRYVDGTVATCAMGAAYEGITGKIPPSTEEPEAHRQVMWCLLTEPEIHPLRSLLFACPAEGCGGHDGQKRMLGSVLVTYLNDRHRWPRERIADWLEGQGL